MTELEWLLSTHLRDPRSGWSMGSFGAIAEFHQDRGEPVVVDEPTSLMRVTRRGAIRLDRTAVRNVTAVAYETLSSKRHRWSHAIALCLKQDEARQARRSVLTELGPDDAAIRGIDRTGIVFDMGLNLPQCNFCIRTSEPKLLGALRSNLGRSLFEHDNPAMPAILSAHPHRVVLSKLGRVEVYQKIGGPDTGGVSPPGPHTHVLPKLLKSGRTHSANTPIPDGLWPVAFLHPGNPVIGPMGEERPFDPELHHDFQMILARYGLSESASAKIGIQDAILRGKDPISYDMPAGRFERAAARIALRQLGRAALHKGDAATQERLSAWQAHFDHGDEQSDDDAPGH
ncbi:MAG: hypothetical protein AB7P20_20030 [Rhizobiaceae bacterium]